MPKFDIKNFTLQRSPTNIHKQLYTSKTSQTTCVCQRRQIQKYLTCFRCQRQIHTCLKPQKNRDNISKYECACCLAQYLDPIYKPQKILLETFYQTRSIFQNENQITFEFVLDVADLKRGFVDIRGIKPGKLELAWPMQGSFLLNKDDHNGDPNSPNNASIKDLKPLLASSNRKERAEEHLTIGTDQLKLGVNRLTFKINQLTEKFKTKHMFEETGLYFLGIYSVRKLTPQQCKTLTLQEGRVHEKLYTLQLANTSGIFSDDMDMEDDSVNPQKIPQQSDLQVDSCKINLIDPYIGEKIQFPSRGRYCKHITPICLMVYLQIQSKPRTWKCPICKGPLNEPYIDLWLLELVQKHKNIRSVMIYKNGGYECEEGADDMSDEEDQGMDLMDEEDVGGNGEGTMVIKDADRNASDGRMQNVNSNSSNMGIVQGLSLPPLLIEEQNQQQQQLRQHQRSDWSNRPENTMMIIQQEQHSREPFSSLSHGGPQNLLEIESQSRRVTDNADQDLLYRHHGDNEDNENDQIRRVGDQFLMSERDERTMLGGLGMEVGDNDDDVREEGLLMAQGQLQEQPSAEQNNQQEESGRRVEVIDLEDDDQIVQEYSNRQKNEMKSKKPKETDLYGIKGQAEVKRQKAKTIKQSKIEPKVKTSKEEKSLTQAPPDSSKKTGLAQKILQKLSSSDKFSNINKPQLFHQAHIKKQSKQQTKAKDSLTKNISKKDHTKKRQPSSRPPSFSQQPTKKVILNNRKPNQSQKATKTSQPQASTPSFSFPKVNTTFVPSKSMLKTLSINKTSADIGKYPSSQFMGFNANFEQHYDVDSNMAYGSNNIDSQFVDTAKNDSIQSQSSNPFVNRIEAIAKKNDWSERMKEEWYRRTQKIATMNFTQMGQNEYYKKYCQVPISFYSKISVGDEFKKMFKRVL